MIKPVTVGYYVYLLLDPSSEGTPFYVGKGKGYRATNHYTNRSVAGRTPNAAVICRYRKSGYEDTYRIVSEGLSEPDAFELERRLIRLYGRLCEGGSLTNRSKGGEGSSGCNQPKTEGHKRAISESKKGVLFSEEHRKSLSHSKKGCEISQDHRQKISASLTGRKQSEAHRRAESRVQKGKTLSPEHRTKAIQNLRNDNGSLWYNVTYPEGSSQKVYNLADFLQNKRTK
jgi:hypothetical protein